MTADSNRAYGFLWLLVALQVAIPASYYLRGTERDDERFAWRMFSAVRVKRCDVELREQRGEHLRPVELEHVVHASWRNALGRGRPRVIARLLETRCALGGATQVVLLRRCRDADGDVLPEERYARTCLARSGP